MLGIFNVRTDVNASDCRRGCTDTVRESALKVDSGRIIPCLTGGIEPASAACRSGALPTELHPRPTELLTVTHLGFECRLQVADFAG